ncbi:MAG: exosortase/archaeosortase family protein [Agriterribacter sp.]
MTAKSVIQNIKSVNQYIDLGFLAKFIGMFLAFYYANHFFVELVSPESKSYNAYIATHYNYVSWSISSLTHMSGYIGELMGVENYIKGDALLVSSIHRGVYVKWQCIGLGIYSFWLAFILAHKMSIGRKILYSVGGIVLMWLLNCFRIALLLYGIAHNLKPWKKSLKFIGNINHHDLYNFVCYMLIIAGIYLYYRKTSKKAAIVKD